MHCDLADTELYGNRITEFTPITEITDPEEIINFTYMPKLYNHITNKARITWQGDLITSGYCITANACEGCQSIALILLIPYHYVFCTYKYMIYSQIMSLNPRERAGFHPSGHPQPSHRLPVLFGFLLVLSSKFHIFWEKL